MSRIVLFVSALLLSGWLSSAHAITTGDIVDIRYIVTNFSESEDLGLEVGPGVELDCAIVTTFNSACGISFANTSLESVDFDPDADTITIKWDGGASFAATDFNGFEFSQIDGAIASVDVECNTISGGSCQPDVTFGFDSVLGNFVRVNYASFGFGTLPVDTILTVTPIPIPATLPLFSLALAALGAIRIRR